MGFIITYIILEILGVIFFLPLDDDEFNNFFDKLNIFGNLFFIILYLPWVIIGGFFYGIYKLFTWHPEKKEKDENKEKSNKEITHIDLKI